MSKKTIVIVAIILLIIISIFILLIIVSKQSKEVSIYVDMQEKTIYMEELKNGKHKEYKIVDPENIDQLMKEYQKIVEKDLSSYYPEDEQEVVEIKWQLSYTAEEEDSSYRYAGVLVYPEGWEEFIKQLKEKSAS